MTPIFIRNIFKVSDLNCFWHALGDKSLPMLKDRLVFVGETCARLVKRVSCFHSRQIMQMSSCKKVKFMDSRALTPFLDDPRLVLSTESPLPLS